MMVAMAILCLYIYMSLYCDALITISTVISDTLVTISTVIFESKSDKIK